MSGPEPCAVSSRPLIVDVPTVIREFGRRPPCSVCPMLILPGCGRNGTASARDNQAVAQLLDRNIEARYRDFSDIYQLFHHDCRTSARSHLLGQIAVTRT